MSDRDATVQVRVTDERKEEWNNAADERGMSLSDFLRMAVTNEIKGRGGDADGSVTVDTSPVAAELEAVTNRLMELEDAVTYANDQLETLSEGDAVPDEMKASLSASELIRVLPDEPDDLEIDPPTMVGTELNHTVAQNEGATPEDVSDKLNVPVTVVRESLRNLARKSGRIVRINLEQDHEVYFADV